MVNRKVYEGSKADNAADKAGARRSGMSMKQWENSAADKKKDKAGQAKMSAKKR